MQQTPLALETDQMAKQTTSPYGDWDFAKFADFEKLTAQFAAPGVDAGALAEAQRKNIEALSAVNRAAYAGAQVIAQRQIEMVRDGMNEAVKAARELSRLGSPQDRLAKQAEVMKESYETALANWRELAELNARSGNEVIELIHKRVSEGLDEVRQAANGAAK